MVKSLADWNTKEIANKKLKIADFRFSDSEFSDMLFAEKSSYSTWHLVK
jgi:hypothetical protein